MNQITDFKLTTGVKNIINNSESTNIKKFWELNKISKVQNQDTKVRTNNIMISLANEIIKNEEIEITNKFYDFIKKYSKATIKFNNFNKPLWISFN